ncbi:MAG: hypothetical protein ACKO6N_15435 [Myxococcota bacterium]
MDTSLQRLAQLRRETQLENGPHVAEELLRQLQRGQLPPIQQEEVERHTSSCAVCREALLSLDLHVPQLSASRKAALIQALSASTAPPSAAEATLPHHSAWGPMFGRGLQVVLPLSLVALAWFFFRGAPDDNTSALPPYHMTLAGAVQEVRGEPTSTALPLLVPTSQLVLELAPARGQVLEPPTAWLYLPDISGWKRSDAPLQQVPLRQGKLVVSVEAQTLLGQQFGKLCLLVWLRSSSETPPTLLKTTPPQALEQCVYYQPSP